MKSPPIPNYKSTIQICTMRQTILSGGMVLWLHTTLHTLSHQTTPRHLFRRSCVQMLHPAVCRTPLLCYISCFRPHNTHTFHLVSRSIEDTSAEPITRNSKSGQTEQSSTYRYFQIHSCPAPYREILLRPPHSSEYNR